MILRKTVTRIVVMIVGCAFTVLITGCPPEVVPAFKAKPLSGTVPLDVTFTDLSLAGNQTITKWQWVFGDGSLSEEQNPVHRYGQPGTYDVSLSVTNDSGTKTMLKDKYITVTANSTPGISVVDFGANSRTGLAPFDVVFTDLSVVRQETIVKWEWSFGDGGVSGEQHPVYRYNLPGIYDVSLRITTNNNTEITSKAGYIEATGCPDPGQSTIDPPNMQYVPEVTYDQSKYLGSDLNWKHTVKLSPYGIGTYEISNIQYCSVLNWALDKYVLRMNDIVYSNPNSIAFGNGNQRVLIKLDSSDEYRCKIAYDSACSVYVVTQGFGQHPVVSVTWHGAVAFCNWLSEMEGRVPCYDLTSWSLTKAREGGYRLPTESEWECAAGAQIPVGTAKPYIYRYGVGSDTKPTAAMVNNGNYYSAVAPVGYFNGTNEGTILTKSPLGCFDMQGNVAEWCGDWYDIGYYNDCQEQGTVTNPMGPTSNKTNRVVRDSSYAGSIYDTSERHYAPPETTSARLGFRVVRN